MTSSLVFGSRSEFSKTLLLRVAKAPAAQQMRLCTDVCPWGKVNSKAEGTAPHYRGLNVNRLFVGRDAEKSSDGWRRSLVFFLFFFFSVHGQMEKFAKPGKSTKYAGKIFCVGDDGGLFICSFTAGVWKTARRFQGLGRKAHVMATKKRIRFKKSKSLTVLKVSWRSLGNKACLRYIFCYLKSHKVLNDQSITLQCHQPFLFSHLLTVACRRLGWQVTFRRVSKITSHCSHHVAHGY